MVASTFIVTCGAIVGVDGEVIVGVGAISAEGVIAGGSKAIRLGIPVGRVGSWIAPVSHRVGFDG